MEEDGGTGYAGTGWWGKLAVLESLLQLRQRPHLLLLTQVNGRVYLILPSAWWLTSSSQVHGGLPGTARVNYHHVQ